MSPAFMEAVIARDFAGAEAEVGVPLPAFFREEAFSHLKYRLGMVRANPDALPWLTRLLVHRAEHTAVGHAGFHEPPGARGWAEVGYTVFPEHRRRGYAEEAVRGLFDWAHAEHGVGRFRASVGSWNQPSLGLLRKLGFKPVGTQVDEIDGEELVFEVDWPHLPAPGEQVRPEAPT
jgi:ribosomal-protein-alanine N-acetyltransferase